MAFLADLLSWICLIAGSALALIGGLGLLRLPDVFSRMHGAGIIDTLGLGLILVGLMFQAGFTLITVKLILIFVFVLYTSPTTTHALAQACLNGGVRPQAARKDPSGEPSSTP
jgi:multicomponent Na+:H+ antiporter subunit G